MTNFENIRLIALDLDDTTLRSDGSLSSQTKKAIQAAIGAGLEVVVASGRSLHSLPKAVGDTRHTLCHNLKRSRRREHRGR